ncbi:MAG: response regulator [Spirochaetaceae bacterium]|jgi:two-component system response regulator YesN|nr:response regulator [Spirochaetaceae bacterium]
MFRLLIADDEQLEREALRFIISKSIDSISDIEEAVNGRDALAKVQASKPDIIILDINMPGINGIEAAWKIREKDQSVCIIFLTAFHQFDYAHEAIKVGVEDYIVKPSSEKRIIEVMEKVTAKLKDKKTDLMKRENLEIRLDKATDYLSSEFIYNLATRNMTEEKFRNYLT